MFTKCLVDSKNAAYVYKRQFLQKDHIRLTSGVKQLISIFHFSEGEGRNVSGYAHAGPGQIHAQARLQRFQQRNASEYNRT